MLSYASQVLASDVAGGSSPPFEPDTLLPAQFYREARGEVESTPERRLIIAILGDAFECYRKWAKRGASRPEFIDAERWILQKDWEWPFSFNNVCSFLDLDPAYVRKGAVRWKEQALRGDVRYVPQRVRGATRCTGQLRPKPRRPRH